MRIRNAAIVLALALTSCDGPNAGELMFDLSTPNSDDGAIQFTIVATPGYEMLDLEAACATCRVFARPVDERTTLGIITGQIDGGALLRAVVSNPGRPAAYLITVVEVSSRTYELRSVEGYSISVSR